MTFAWTMVAGFRLLSVTWIRFVNLWDLVGLFSYQLLTNLIESLLVLGSLLLVAAVLPGSWLRDDFLARAGAAAFVALGGLMISALSLEAWILLESAPTLLGGILVAALLVVQATRRFALLRRLVLDVADRCVIFLYVLIPLSMLAGLVVLVRNVPWTPA
jgi:hypothetical protein